MSIRFQKKSIYVLVFVAATSAFVVMFIFLYPQEEPFRPWPWEAESSESAAEAPGAAESSESTAEAPGVPDSPGTEETRATVDQRITEARAHTPEEMGRYIDRMGSRYSHAQKYLSQADVPALINILADPSQSGKWAHAVRLLAYIDKEEESVDGLVAFIQRGEDWAEFSDPPPHKVMYTKTDAISTLGFIGGDFATDTLKLLLTEEGADQFLSQWINDEIPGPTIARRRLIRGRAAMGLVYTQDAANIRLVEDLYGSVFPLVRVIQQRPGWGGYDSKCKTDEERQQCALYSHWVSALVIRDLIETRGMEEYKSMLYDNDSVTSAFSRHSAPYRQLLKE